MVLTCALRVRCVYVYKEGYRIRAWISPYFKLSHPDSEEFNRILHNARPDALEIQDIVQFYFVLLGRIEKHIAAKSAVAIVD